MTHQGGAPVGRRVQSLARVLANPGSALNATAWFTVITVVMTWPLSSGPARFVVQDLGDPLLNCWILGWGADHLLQALRGDFAALAGFWHANIFHPEPLALAYSEHLFAQAVQILPVYALTRDLVLSYNLLFLSTFVLSALGAYLLVRELTGNAAAAFVAGLIYGFVPYRIAHFEHLQVLSSQWMPFALFFLRRYFDRRRARWLTMAAAALVFQNLSCGYYLVYFSPFVAAYVLYEMATRGLIRDTRSWAALSAAGAAVALLTIPFLFPYLDLRWRGAAVRAPGELDLYSADVFGYLTASQRLHLWGGLLRLAVKREGEVLLGFVPVALAIGGLAVHARRAWALASPVAGPVQSERWLARAACAIGGIATAFTCVVLLAGRGAQALRGVSPYLANISYIAPVAVVAWLVLLLLSPRARAFVHGVPGSPPLFYLAATAAAVYFSFGRTIRSMGQRVSNRTIYDWLYRYVPGFDGLRVPSRHAMLAALFLAVLAGFGAAALSGAGRRGRALVFAAGVLFLVEAAAAPISVQTLAWPVQSAAASSQALSSADAGRIYQIVGTLPRDAVLTEFPFGVPEDEVRYMFFSTQHWRRLTNGYSGAFPDSYLRRRALLERPWANPEEAWAELLASGTTYAVVHEWAFPGTAGAEVSGWLRRRGARAIAAHQTDIIFALR